MPRHSSMITARRFPRANRRRKRRLTRGFFFSAATRRDTASSTSDTVAPASATLPRAGMDKVGHGVATSNNTTEQAHKPQWSPSIGDPAHWRVERSKEPVNGADLLDAIAAEFEKYLVLPSHAAEALTLWVVHTYVIDAGDVSPILAVTSPTKRCGKTTLIKLLAWLAFRTLPVSNISAASIFRYVDAKRPTLLIDEGDTFLTGNNEMRGILNAGHSRGAAGAAYIMRSRGSGVVRYSTWGPKAIALIGALPATLADRSITVSMQRKTSTEPRARYRDRDCQDFQSLRSRTLRWAADNFKSLADSDHEIPAVLNDRAADNWRPLIAIADLAGGRWPKAARRAAVALSGATEDDSTDMLLLRDLHWIYDGKPEERDGAVRREYEPTDKLFSHKLVAELRDIETSPWAGWRHGKGFTDRDLAKALKPYGAAPETIRIGPATAKGYYAAKLADAFERYLPLSGSVTASQANKNGNNSQGLSGTRAADVTHETVQKAPPDWDCDGVTLLKGELAPTPGRMRRPTLGVAIACIRDNGLFQALACSGPASTAFASYRPPRWGR